MVRELKGGEVFNSHPLFSGEMAQYDVQTLNFWPSEKFLSIADIGPS
jgi:hypothetical protein